MSGTLDFAITLDRADALSGFDQVRRANSTLRSTVGAARNTAVLLGSSLAPEITAQIMTVSSVIKSVGNVAKASGAGVGTLSGALAVVAAFAWTAKSAFDAFKASAQWKEGEAGLAGQLGKFYESAEGRADKLRNKMDEMVDNGTLTPQTRDAFRKMLMPVSSNTEWRQNIQFVEGNVKLVEQQQKAVGKLDDLQREMLVNSLAGYDKQRAAAYKLYEERVKQIEDLKKAGQFPAEEIAARALQTAKDELKQNLVDTTKTPKVNFRESKQASELERIGLVLTTGVGFGSDPGRNTAENTRRMLEEQRKTNTLLAGGGASFERK